MMKRISVIFLLLCTLSGCSSHQETSVPEKLTEAPTVESTTEAPILPTKPAWEKYAMQYGAEDVFADLYTPGKYLLIGEDTVVLLVSIGGYDQLTVMDRYAIARVEQKNLPDFTQIEIYDKTDEKLSLIVSPQDGATIGKLLG